MATKYGVFTQQQNTSLSTPNTAESGITFFIGAAPVQGAENPAKAGVPVLVTSWTEAVEKLGYSDDWEKYGLCEAMNSHFKLYAVQPAIFCNLLDTDSMRQSVSAAEYSVAGHAVSLPYEAIPGSISVSASGTELTEDTDYTVTWDADNGEAVIALLSSGSAYDATALTVSYAAVDPSQVDYDVVAAGCESVELCMSTVGVIPDLICAPGYSTNLTVAAVMAAKAEAINGLFPAKALIDIDTTQCADYASAVSYKNENGLTDANTVVCWPMLALNGKKYHQSTQLAGLIAQVDTDNGGCPYESPSNKSYQMDALILADGTEIQQSKAQADLLRSNGIVTALNFWSSGWVAWGSYTACYPANTDVKDYMLPVSRMFAWVGKTLIGTFWSKVDKPMTKALVASIQDSTNIWLNGLAASGYVHGARVAILDEENTVTDLMAGKIKFHVYIAPPSPAQEIDFVLEYDSSYITAALS